MRLNGSHHWQPGAPILIIGLRSIFHYNRGHGFPLLFQPDVDTPVQPALPLPDPLRRVVDSLFRRFSVEVFVVGLRIGAGVVDDAVPMIWGRIDRVELQ